MKALVAGGTGVLGAAVVEELHRNHVPVVHLSRHRTPHPDWTYGDITREGLGLDEERAQSLRREVTHVVNCAGSVDLASGPVTAEEVFLRGTGNLQRFLGSCRTPRHYVHASSILVFGRTDKEVGNHDLDVGQHFRSCYERAKFDAEQLLRRASADFEVTIVRFGPILGADGPVLPSTAHGILSVLPYLLKNYPVPIAERGQFPCYPADSRHAARVLAAALQSRHSSADTRVSTWTYFDPASPTLNQTLTGLCAAWNVVPRIIDLPVSRLLGYAVGPRLGLPRSVLPYSRSWVRLASTVLDPLPPTLLEPAPNFVVKTGNALRERSKELMTA